METVSSSVISGFLSEHELTQKSVAKTLGYSAPSLNNIIKGKAKISIPMAFALGGYFNSLDDSHDWVEVLLSARIKDDTSEFAAKAERYKKLITGELK